LGGAEYFLLMNISARYWRWQVVLQGTRAPEEIVFGGRLFCLIQNSALAPRFRGSCLSSDPGKSLPPFRLDLGSAAVNEQFDPRDETRVIRREKQCHLSNFLGFPHASHRDRGHHPRNDVCGLPTR